MRVFLIFVMVIGATVGYGQTRVPAACADDACSKTGILVNQYGGMKAIAATDHYVELKWLRSSGAAFYNVYRGLQAGGPYSIVNANPVFAQGWHDFQVVSGTTYYYVATASCFTCTESGYSNETQAVIP